MIQFVTEVRTVPIGHTPTETSWNGAPSQLPRHLREAFQQVGVQISNVWKVPSDSFDLKMFGKAQADNDLLKIDAICRGLGYEARTNLAFEETDAVRAGQEAEKILASVGSKMPTSTGAGVR